MAHLPCVRCRMRGRSDPSRCRSCPWHLMPSTRCAAATLSTIVEALLLLLVLHSAGLSWGSARQGQRVSLHARSEMFVAAVQPKPREQVVETMLQYLHTDSACCRDEPGPLADRQAQVLLVPVASSRRADSHSLHRSAACMSKQLRRVWNPEHPTERRRPLQHHHL